MTPDCTTRFTDDADYICTVRRSLSARVLSLGLLRDIESSLLELCAPATNTVGYKLRIEVHGRYESEFLSSLDQWEHRPPHQIESITFSVEDDPAFVALLEISREEPGSLTLCTDRASMRPSLESTCENLADLIEAAPAPDSTGESTKVNQSLSFPAITTNLAQLQRLCSELREGLRKVATSALEPGRVVEDDIEWGVSTASGRTLHLLALSEAPIHQLKGKVGRISLSVDIDTDTDNFHVEITMARTYCIASLTGKGPMSTRFAGEVVPTLTTHFTNRHSSHSFLYKNKGLVPLTLSLAIWVVIPILTILVPEHESPELLLTSFALGFLSTILFTQNIEHLYPYCTFELADQRPLALGPYGLLSVLVMINLLPLLVALALD